MKMIFSSENASLKRLEWSLINCFLSICQTHNLSETAKALGISRSGVSTQLTQFEEIIGLSLIDRETNRIYINEQASFLAKYFFPLSVLEQFASEEKERTQEIQWVSIQMPLHHYGGVLSRTLARTIYQNLHRFPNILLLPQLFDSFDIRHTQDIEWEPQWHRVGHVRFFWSNFPEKNHLPSRWCLLSNKGSKEKTLKVSALKGLKLSLPKMPWELLSTISKACLDLNLSFEHISVDYRQLLSRPNDDKKNILLNSLLFDPSTLSKDWYVTYLDDLPLSYLNIEAHGHHPCITQFTQNFLEESKALSETFAWQPTTQLRHWYYFQQVVQSKTLTQASEKLFITQPALSIQIKTLEKKLQVKLVERHEGQRTLTVTRAGQHFLELCQGVSQSFSSLLDYVNQQRIDKKKHLIIGILPSVDAQSKLLELVVKKISHWRQSYPDIRIEVVEERHRYLVDMLRSHSLHLAIIEAESPWVEQVMLQEPEVMGLVGTPEVIGKKSQTINWSDLNSFNLILPRKDSGLRILIDQHCLSHGVQLNPALESDSLNLNQYLIKNEQMVSILPQSAISNLIQQGELVFVPLTPMLNRTLRFAYLKNRILTPVEQSLIQFLTKEN